MNKVIGVIIGLAVYFIGGWIADEILSSAFNIDFLNKSFREVHLWNCYTYLIITAIYCIVYEYLVDDQNLFSSISALGVMAFLIYYLPMSYGTVVLFNIVNIGAIIWSVCTCNKK